LLLKAVSIHENILKKQLAGYPNWKPISFNACLNFNKKTDHASFMPVIFAFVSNPSANKI